MSGVSTKVFRVLLILLGIVNVFVGINLAFGGILTLGWQGEKNFLEITNEHAFLVQDSNTRFFGGVYIGVGLYVLLAVNNLRKHQTGLKLVFFLIFMGGLARLTMMRPDILFGRELLSPLVAELLVMPVLYLWLSKIVKSSESSVSL
jgi:uncharacterized protein DUF4345